MEQRSSAKVKQEVTVYTSTMCPACNMLCNFLTDMNVVYREVNIDFNPIAMVKLIRTTKRFGVPQTHIDGEWIFGFDPERILEVMQTAEKRKSKPEVEKRDSEVVR